RFFWAVNGQLLGRPLAHEGVVRSVALSPDGRHGVTAAGVGGFRTWTARLWDLPPPPAAARCPLAGGAVETLAFGPRGGFLAAGLRLTGVRVFNLAGGPAVD